VCVWVSNDDCCCRGAVLCLPFFPAPFFAYKFVFPHNHSCSRYRVLKRSESHCCKMAEHPDCYAALNFTYPGGSNLSAAITQWLHIPLLLTPRITCICCAASHAWRRITPRVLLKSCMISAIVTTPARADLPCTLLSEARVRLAPRAPYGKLAP
jgi:hypothetical protein